MHVASAPKASFNRVKIAVLDAAETHARAQEISRRVKDSMLTSMTHKELAQGLLHLKVAQALGNSMPGSDLTEAPEYHFAIRHVQAELATRL